VLVWQREEVQALPRRVDALSALVLLGLAGFTVLALTYEGRLGGLDADVARWVADELPGLLEALARPFSWLGGWIGLVVLGVVGGTVLARERAWLDLAFFLTAFLGSQLVVSILKDGFGRERPDLGSPVPLPDSASFPSGHATAGAASLGAAAILASERLASRRARVSLWAATVALGLAVGLSRIALNVHFASDVLAGWCLGIAWLAGCLLVRDALAGRARAA
jgi:undecaprenyl-diphosphatase